MATIIDALVVTLGLDTTDYDKKSKNAEREQTKFKDTTKKTGIDIGANLKKLGLAAAGVFLGFETLKGAIVAWGGLLVNNANLGRFAANVGQSAHEVNTWGMAVELAGGNAADAQADIQNLQQSITNLKATGERSSLINLFQRLGVAVYDASGKTRKLVDIYKDAGDKLRAFNRADAAALARGAGISDSTLNLILAEGKERERLITLAESNNKVNEQSIKDAQKLQEEWREVGQDITDVGNIISSFLAPKVLGLFNLIKNHGKQIAGGVLATMSGQLPTILSTSLAQRAIQYNIDKQKAKAAAQAKADAARKGTIARPGGAAPEKNSIADLKQKLSAAEAAYGIPSGVLTNIANTESHFRPDIISGQTKSSAGATGLMQLRPQYFPNAGKDASADIDEAARYLKQLYVQFGDWTKAVAAYNDGPGNVNKVLAGKKALPDETKKYIDSVLGPQANAAAIASMSRVQVAQATQSPTGAAGGAGGTKYDVTFEHVEVNTQATDADGIANDLGAAVKRKNIVNQADSGMS